MSDTTISPDFTEGFTNPFRYSPHPMVREAAGLVMERVKAQPEQIRKGFDEGKMMGVLVVKLPPGITGFTDWLDRDRQIGFLAGFSGSVNGTGHIDGFVPPVFDLFAPDGEYRRKEADISALSSRINLLENSPALVRLRNEADEAEQKRDEEIGLMKARMVISKRERDDIRSELSDPSRMAELIRESQFEKAELRRLKIGWDECIAEIRTRLQDLLDEINELKAERSSRSDSLQKWIFEQYIVSNALDEKTSVWKLFMDQGLVPPGGTGDCAAPKLLEYAYKTGAEPLAMGEFWYGRDSVTAVRCHGHFYPSCTSKCGPLMNFMTKGLREESSFQNDRRIIPDPSIIYKDESITVIEKCSGMPSVPGLDGRRSVLEYLETQHSTIFDRHRYEAVHRLDMDTSGVMVFARNPEAAINLRRQFEAHTIHKTYVARLCPASADKQTDSCKHNVCRIELPLSADYDERPRQKVDFTQGKSAVTEYEVIETYPDGCTDIIFHPVTGRTHQLRVHSAHSLGLRRPILGDTLYGGAEQDTRLHLHALSITFNHPRTGKELTFISSIHHFR